MNKKPTPQKEKYSDNTFYLLDNKRTSADNNKYQINPVKPIFAKMKISKDSLNKKYFLQHLAGYADNLIVFVQDPNDESKISPVTSITEVSLCNDGKNLTTGEPNAFLLETGKGSPKTTKEITEIVKKLPKNAISIAQISKNNLFSTIVSSQIIQTTQNGNNFNMARSGAYNGVLFGCNED